MQEPSAEVKAEVLEQYGRKLAGLQAGGFKKLFDIAHRNCDRIPFKELEVQALLGQGAYAEVYKANLRGTAVAIKVQFKAAFTRDSVALIDEKKFLCAMHSVFIPRVWGVWQDYKYLYMYTDLAVHGDLGEIASLHHPMSEKVVRAIFFEVTCALEYIHACNVVYRDLKPQNVLWFENGRIKIGDFGTSAFCRADLNGFFSPLAMAAPEIFAKQLYNESVDYWALGMMLYMVAYDSFPFNICADENVEETRASVALKIKKPLGELNERPELSQAFKDYMVDLLQVDPSQRLGTSKEGIAAVKNHSWFHHEDAWRVIFRDEYPIELQPEIAKGEENPPSLRDLQNVKPADPNDPIWKDF